DDLGRDVGDLGVEVVVDVTVVSGDRGLHVVDGGVGGEGREDVPRRSQAVAEAAATFGDELVRRTVGHDPAAAGLVLHLPLLDDRLQEDVRRVPVDDSVDVGPLH